MERVIFMIFVQLLQFLGDAAHPPDKKKQHFKVIPAARPLEIHEKSLNFNFFFAEFEALKRPQHVSRPQILQNKSLNLIFFCTSKV